MKGLGLRAYFLRVGSAPTVKHNCEAGAVAHPKVRSASRRRHQDHEPLPLWNESIVWPQTSAGRSRSAANLPKDESQERQCQISWKLAPVGTSSTSAESRRVNALVRGQSELSPKWECWANGRPAGQEQPRAAPSGAAPRARFHAEARLPAPASGGHAPRRLAPHCEQRCPWRAHAKSAAPKAPILPHTPRACSGRTVLEGPLVGFVVHPRFTAIVRNGGDRQAACQS